MDQTQIDLFLGTSVYDALRMMNNIYRNIAKAQAPWRTVAVSTCPEGCGSCCLDFEPDILAAEALYSAVWLYFNNRIVFDHLLSESVVISSRNDSLDHPSGCVFYNPENRNAHCSIYGGRMLICRLFGYCGDHDKNNELRWRPCRFIPDDNMGIIEHRQYNTEELMNICGVVPPDMSIFTSEALGIFPGNNETHLLRDALPLAVKKINIIISFIKPPKPNKPDPSTPDKPRQPAA